MKAEILERELLTLQNDFKRDSKRRQLRSKSLSWGDRFK